MTASAPSPGRPLALAGSLPVLLEYRGRRWRISAGLLIEGLLLGSILSVPLLFPDHFPAVQIAEVSPPIWRGDPNGNPNANKLGGGKQSKSNRPDRESILTIPVRIPDYLPDGNLTSKAPDIGNGDGNGNRRGVPDGPIEGIPPVGVLPTTAPQPPEPVPPVVKVGGQIRPPRLLQRVEPVYPRLAIAAHIEGDVVVTAIIETDGRVRQVAVKSGHPLLAPAAEAAVPQWLYEPTRLNGQPVAVQLDVIVKFRLKR